MGMGNPQGTEEAEGALSLRVEGRGQGIKEVVFTLWQDEESTRRGLVRGFMSCGPRPMVKTSCFRTEGHLASLGGTEGSKRASLRDLGSWGGQWGRTGF